MYSFEFLLTEDRQVQSLAIYGPNKHPGSNGERECLYFSCNQQREYSLAGGIPENFPDITLLRSTLGSVDGILVNVLRDVRGDSVIRTPPIVIHFVSGTNAEQNNKRTILPDEMIGYVHEQRKKGKYSIIGLTGYFEFRQIWSLGVLARSSGHRQTEGHCHFDKRRQRSHYWETHSILWKSEIAFLSKEAFENGADIVGEWSDIVKNSFTHNLALNYSGPTEVVPLPVPQSTIGPEAETTTVHHITSPDGALLTVRLQLEQGSTHSPEKVLQANLSELQQASLSEPPIVKVSMRDNSHL
jgi:hypothetical protein